MRIPKPGSINTLGKRIMYRLPHYTSISPRYGDWRSHAIASHLVMEYDTAPEGEDDRKPPAPEGDMDSKCTAPDKVDAASMCTAPEGEPGSSCTAPEDIIDRKNERKKEKRNLSKKRKHDTKARHSSQALISSIILLLGPSGS